MPSLLNPVVKALLLRSVVTGTAPIGGDTLAGLDVRPRPRVHALVAPGPSSRARCGATTRPAPRSPACRTARARGRERRGVTVSWPGRCVSADPGKRAPRPRRPPCLRR